MTDEPRHPDTIDASFVPRLRDEVAFVPVADEAMLYVEETGLLHQLDPIGAAIYRVFDGRTTIADSATELAHAFGAPRQTVEADVVSFARELGRLGLLEGVQGEEPVDDADGADPARPGHGP
jgi:hypothetical protein